MFRYTPNSRVNADSDTFTVIADDGPWWIARFDGDVGQCQPRSVAVAPPTLWPADPTTGAVTVSPNIVHPTVIGWPSRSTSRCRSEVR